MAKRDNQSQSKRIGILNKGKHNRFINNDFNGMDIGIQDEGEHTVAVGNRFNDESRAPIGRQISLEDKIQKEAERNLGRALDRNALKYGIEAFSFLAGPAKKPLEALGKLFIERGEIKEAEEQKAKINVLLDYIMAIEDKQEKGGGEVNPPVLDIIGTGKGWAKETQGSVVITGSGKRTVVKVTGPGGWKIIGPESISDM